MTEPCTYRTVIALNGESRVASQWHMAAITRRAERAQTLAREHKREHRPYHPRTQQEREVLTDGR
jgi:cob(I)alamin adenosyltransferase